MLNRLISTDDGARRLGEVALVPAVVADCCVEDLYWSTLFDENAASHIALGQAYSTCLIGGEKMTNDELTAARRELQPDPRGLDDRVGGDGRGRDFRGRDEPAVDARRRMGLAAPWAQYCPSFSYISAGESMKIEEIYFSSAAHSASQFAVN